MEIGFEKSLIKIIKVGSKTERSVGFFFNEYGWAITTHHSVKTRDVINCYMLDQNGIYNQPVEYEIIQYNEDLDIALIGPIYDLQVPTTPLKFEKNPTLINREGKTFGFTLENGSPGRAKIIGKQTFSHSGRQMYTLDKGNSISLGFSGAPFVDVNNERVLAMIESMPLNNQNGRLVNINFALPSEKIINWLIGIDIKVIIDEDINTEDKIRLLFFEILEKAFYGQLGLISSFSEKYYGIDTSALSQNINTGNFISILFKHVKNSDGQNKWSGFIDILKKAGKENFCKSYEDEFKNFDGK